MQSKPSKIIYALVTVIAVSIMSGCATRTELVEPECGVPEWPNPPTVSGEELRPLDYDVYQRVLRRDNMLINHLRVRQAMLRELCQ